ncbi:MAG: thioredoxin-like domain-containing protein [Candidatus Kryptoniota bacterium]
MFKAILQLLFTCFITINVMAQTTITGKITDQDGKPMPIANVVLKLSTDNTPLKVAKVDKEGQYSITIDSTGVWVLYFVGVYHEPQEVAVFSDKPAALKLNVKLSTYRYSDTLSQVKVVGNFNSWSSQTAVPMQKQSDGTFSAEVESKSDSVAYRLENVIQGDAIDGNLVEGTQADDFAYNDYSGYNSIVHAIAGSVKIVFDPSKLIKSSLPAEVTFADSASFDAQFADAYHEMRNNIEAYELVIMDYQRSGKSIRDVKYDWSKEVKAIETKIADEKDPVLRQEFLISYLLLGGMKAPMDSVIAAKAMSEISPSSVMWTIDPDFIYYGLQFSKASPEESDSYYDKVVAENPSVVVRAFALVQEFVQAKYSNENAKATRYYSELLNNYGNTQYAKLAKQRFSPESKIKLGIPVPDFSVVSLDDSSKIMTNESLKGKYYLMDFWATWCGPCVGEMDNLQNTYDKYKNMNFEILSLSLDASRQDVVTFRKNKWHMPWLNTFVGTSQDVKILKDFDIISIPCPILVDPSGKIIALGEELRGAELDSTLGKYLNK